MFRLAQSLRDRGEPGAEGWFRKAAEAGHKHAMHVLASMLEERDDPEADAWRREADSAHG